MEGGGVRRKACARCQKQRRKCKPDCMFAPYFPADQRQSFADVHKVFGADNFIKIIQELPEDRQGDAARSMVYEANARVREPVYGCVGEITALQRQLADMTAEVGRLQVLLEANSSLTATDPCQPEQ